MDFNDPESSTEFDGEQRHNEVVPSCETSVTDNELTTTNADEHKQHSLPVDGVPSSNGANSGVKNQLHTTNRKVFETNAIDQPESDGGGSAAGLKSESDTESESRLVIQSENETTDNDTATTVTATATAAAPPQPPATPTTTPTSTSSSAIKENGGSVSLKSSAKRKSSAKLNNTAAASDNTDGIEFSDDDEQFFFGFTTDDIAKCTSWAPSVLLKRIKTTKSPVSISNNTIEEKIEKKIELKTMNDVKQPVSESMVLQKTAAQPVPVPLPSPLVAASGEKDNSSAHIIKTDPRYRNPFKYGWRREVVFRANPQNIIQKSDNRGEVYYHSPSGKKLRTKADIQAELRVLKNQNLDIGDFSFAKESVGMPPELEIVRSAKIQTPSQKRQSASIPEPIQPPEVLGKRIPKPKMPKGASPPPPSTANKSRLSIPSNKRQLEKEVIEVIQPKVAKLSTKSNRESCTIQCVLAMGMIPQLQCKKCHHMYHHECVGKDGSRHIGTFVCEHCKREKNEAAQNAQAAAVAAATAAATTAAAVAQAAAAAASGGMAITTIPLTSAALTKEHHNNDHTNSTEYLTPIQNRSTKKFANATNKPATHTPAANKPTANDVDLSPPQSVAIVAGRKFIVVPKSAKTHPLPDSIIDKSITKSSSRPHTPVAGTKSTSSLRSSPSLPITNSAYASASTSVHSIFASEFFNNVSRGYDILFNIFQYLKVQELLRASSVCRMWNHVAKNNLLWETVRMKNSQANNWAGLMAALRKHGTRHLDLRKILIDTSLDWNDFISHISQVPELETLHLCRCPSEVVTALLETNTNLRSLSALSITGKTFTFPTSCRMPALTELRLKSGSPMRIENLPALHQLRSLRNLSLTCIESLDASNLEPLTALTGLESLELGECNNLAGAFARNILTKLRSLERLRLEGGKGCATFDILEVIEKLPKLVQLELVNFDIKPGFDTRIAQCRRLKRLLIIPTYISQSATTNNLVLSSIAHLGDTLQSVTWVVTQELIRVTDLYTDECHSEGQPKKPNEDKIPIIKPVPMMRESYKSTSGGDTNTQLVEILPLSQVEKIIRTNIPKLKLKIQKVPFSATWRQTISDTS